MNGLSILVEMELASVTQVYPIGKLWQSFQTATIYK